MTRSASRGVAILGLTAAVLVAGGTPVLAHRDGCHAQHSCPSDSGSYVCGDTGNYSECGYGPGEEPGSGGGSSNTSSSTPADFTAPDDPQVGEVSSLAGVVTVEASAEQGSRIDVTDEASAQVASARATGAPQTIQFRAGDGTHTYNVVATDRAGNRSGIATFSATVDGTPPALPQVTVTPATGLGVYTTLLITGERAAKYAVRVARRGGVVIPALNRDGVLDDGEDLVEILASNGEYEVDVFLSDAAGNAAEAARTPLAVSLPAPTLTLERTSAANDGDVKVTIVGPGLGKGELSFAAAGQSAKASPFTLDAAGNGTLTMPLADATWSATGNVVDFQNRTATARQGNLLVDTVAPVLAASLDAEEAKNAAIAVAFTVEPGTRVTVAGLPGGQQTITDAGEQQVVAQAEDGPYEVVLTAVDEAGNEAVETLNVTVTHPLTLGEGLSALAVLALLAAGASFGGRVLWRRREQMGDARWERKAKRERARLTAAHDTAVAAHAAALAAHARAVEQHRHAVRLFDEKTSRLAELVAEAKDFDGVRDFTLPVKAKPGERLYVRCDGAGLVEMRKPNGTTTATVIDRGTAYITNQRVVFDGDKNREWSWEKLIDSRHTGSDVTMMQVSNRQKISGIAYPGAASATVRRRLELAQAEHAGTRERAVAAAHSELDRHKKSPPTPPSPTSSTPPAAPYLPTADDVRARAGKPPRALPAQLGVDDVNQADQAGAAVRQSS